MRGRRATARAVVAMVGALSALVPTVASGATTGKAPVEQTDAGLAVPAETTAEARAALADREKGTPDAAGLAGPAGRDSAIEERAIAAPANDNFASASTISGASGNTTGDNYGATLQTGEPQHAAVLGGSSVWFRWTAPSSGPVTISTAGSDFDTVLAVYTGGAVGSLTHVASNDDGLPFGYNSQVTFSAVSGTTYRIAVDGYGGQWGDIALSWQRSSAPPHNDVFPGARMFGSVWLATGSTVGATAQTGERSAAVWWSWTATSYGAAVIDTEFSAYDTILRVYEGNQVTGLDLITENDDAPGGGRHSQVAFWTEPGVTYRIALEGYGGLKGDYEVFLYHDQCYPFWFWDVGTSHPFCTEISWLAESGIAGGFPDGSFRPTAPVSRQAMAAFLHRTVGAPPGPYPNPGFPDVGSTHRFRDEIAWLAWNGIASGYPDGRFHPTAPVSRQAMAAFLYRMAGSPTDFVPNPGFRDVPTSHRFYREIAWLAATGVTTGYDDDTFRPSSQVSRQAMAAFLQRSWFLTY